MKSWHRIESTLLSSSQGELLGLHVATEAFIQSLPQTYGSRSTRRHVVAFLANMGGTEAGRFLLDKTNAVATNEAKY